MGVEGGGGMSQTHLHDSFLPLPFLKSILFPRFHFIKSSIPQKEIPGAPLEVKSNAFSIVRLLSDKNLVLLCSLFFKKILSSDPDSK